VGVTIPEVALAGRVALVGGETVQPHRLDTILVDPCAVEVTVPEVPLRDWGVSTKRSHQQIPETPDILLIGNITICAARWTLPRNAPICTLVCAFLTNHLPAAGTHLRVSSSVLHVEADWTRVLERRTAHGTTFRITRCGRVQ
jgi:hypothetical protein